MTESFKEFLDTEKAHELLKIMGNFKGNTLRIHSALSKRTDKQDLLPFLAEMLHLQDLREKAKEKFSKADEMFFTRRGLEQSTGEEIADYKATWIQPKSNILVLCSGIGGEVIALAKKAGHITAIDSDPEMCMIAEKNTDIYGVRKNITFVVDTAEHFIDAYKGVPFDAVYIDPDRRQGEIRKVELSQYLPNIYEILPRLLEISPHVYCKVSPRISRDELEKIPHLLSYEFIQEEQDLKECVLHFSRTTNKIKKIATKIHNHLIQHLMSEETESDKKMLSNEAEILYYLYEPDACIMRSELVEKCAEQIKGVFLAEKGALLTTNTLSQIGREWGTYFEIQKVLPFHAATIKSYCKEQKLEKIILKKRYFPLEPADLRKMLKIKEGGSDIFYCTTLADTKVIIHCRRVLP